MIPFKLKVLAELLKILKNVNLIEPLWALMSLFDHQDI